MQTATDHHVAVLGEHRLALLEVDGDGTHLITARRDGKGGKWTISAEGQPEVQDPERRYTLGEAKVPDVTANNVHEAVQKMADHTLLHLHGSTQVPGYSVHVPHSVRKLDGEESWRAWCDSVGLPYDA